MAKRPPTCQWAGLREALKTFVLCETGPQSAGHIRPLHWYVACRMVIEGGFHPDDITPRPPFTARLEHGRWMLEHHADSGKSGERTILGGLRTKAVDVVVTKNGIGPVLAVSIKGTLNAFRNLTNRLEEAIGDCTNLHIAYPALVYGFFHLVRGNRQGPGVEPSDVAICADGSVAESIRRYHDVLARLADRDDVRADATKYEAVALSVVSPDPPSVGDLITTFPPAGSPLHIDDFFDKLYAQYDRRFVYAAPALETTTRRLVWDPESPALGDARIAEYEARVAP